MEESKNEYSKLLKQIDEIPRTGREPDMNLQGKLKEIVVALHSIDEKLQSGYLNKNYLNELQKQLMKKRLDLLQMGGSFNTLWNWYKTHDSGFFDSFKNVLTEAIRIGEALEKTLKEHKKKLA